ncbi:MAG TPA: beta-ketoacyl synthase N-terminal-like domain-containing protein [Tepidiformaceae bacterium]|nr:beta-ketoacyl synthase N-terminal-like domain-containing protein [Tepidiformaceae bacterium]
MGAVTTCGSGIDPGWGALVAGTEAGGPFEPIEGADSYFAAGIPGDYRPHAGIPRNLVHFLDGGSLTAIDAALQALESAGLGAGAGDARRFAVSDGLPYRAPGQTAIFVPYGHAVARVLGVRGPVIVQGGAEASGMAAIAGGARLIATGAADVVLAGAAQALQVPLLEHLRAQGFATRVAARPFDTRHGGFVPAEGAAYVVIESERHALERGANVLARIAGIGEVFDSTAEPLATSDAAEAGRTSQAALGDAGYLQNQVDLLVSCADGRPALDYAEGMGAQRTFGRHAFFAGVTTVAASLGHALAASGPISVVYALEAMRRQHVFPIAGLETPEQDLELAFVKAARAEKLDCVLVTSLGSGGANVAILLQRG